MPVTVKIKDKVKQEAEHVQPADLSDYILPESRSEGLKAVLIWVFLIVLMVAIFAISEATRGLAIGIAAWWLLTLVLYFMVAPWMLARRLRQHGADYHLARQLPRLGSLVAKASALVGISAPEGFLLPEGTPQVRIAGRRNPYLLIVTKALLDQLQPTEADCLVLRTLVHGRLGNVPRLMLLQFANDTPPAARILIWPIWIYVALLRQNWHELAEQSADRLTLLLMKNHKILLGGMLKLQALTDPIMQSANVTMEDVDTFIRQGNFISVEGTEISTQYKMGQAIHENPYLEERMHQLAAWAKSDEFQAALVKLAEARTGQTKVDDKK